MRRLGPWNPWACGTWPRCTTAHPPFRCPSGRTPKSPEQPECPTPHTDVGHRRAPRLKEPVAGLFRGAFRGRRAVPAPPPGRPIHGHRHRRNSRAGPLPRDDLSRRSRRRQFQRRQGQPGDDHPAVAHRSPRAAPRRPCAARRGRVARQPFGTSRTRCRAAYRSFWPERPRGNPCLRASRNGAGSLRHRCDGVRARRCADPSSGSSATI